MLLSNHNLKRTIKTVVNTNTPSRFIAQSILWRVRYNKVNKQLFKKTLSKDILRRYQEKWRVFGYPVETNTFLLCYNLSGIIDFNIIPEPIYSAIIEPSLNPYKENELSFLATKNIYQKWFADTKVFPKNYLNKIDNFYYDSDLKIIEDIESYIETYDFKYPMICKPSIGTAGGEGVVTINSLEELKDSLNHYSNLVFEEKILQNTFLDSINPGINSIRTCVYRNSSGDFEVLNNSIRFGINGSLDNETAGGVICNINEDGLLNKYAISKYCEKYEHHPNSGIKFSDIEIPFYSGLNELSIKIASQIPLCNLVSLDMCLDKDNNWRCIEVNLNNQATRLSQYAGKGFFGEYTDEVFNRVLSSNYI